MHQDALCPHHELNITHSFFFLFLKKTQIKQLMWNCI